MYVRINQFLTIFCCCVSSNSNSILLGTCTRRNQTFHPITSVIFFYVYFLADYFRLIFWIVKLLRSNNLRFSKALRQQQHTLFDTAANSLLRFVWLGLHYKNQHSGTAGPAVVVSRCSFSFFFRKQILVDPSHQDQKITLSIQAIFNAGMVVTVYRTRP